MANKEIKQLLERVHKDIDIFDFVASSNKNFSIVLTKIDKCSTDFIKKQMGSIVTLMQNYKKNFMDISIGSNHLRNTNGIFLAEGQNLIQVTISDDGTLLLSMDLYNPTGTQVAKLEHNTWASNSQDRFELKVDGDKALLVDKTLKGVILAVKKESQTEVSILQAKFYLPRGMVSEVTPEHWHVGNKLELKDVDTDLHGGAIEI